MQMLSYREAIDHLLSLNQLGIKLGLERMQLLTQALGNPQNSFDSIHIVGTNGKTSTAKITAKILTEHGYKVGTYCSPHITGFSERVQVQSKEVNKREFAEAVGLVAETASEVEMTLPKGDRITQFEILTAVALSIFQSRNVDVAVVEAGLGGRYDATNILSSQVQALTNISLEHTKWLGSTEKEICDEKLAIVPHSGHLITGELSIEAAIRVDEIVGERAVRVEKAGEDFHWHTDGRRISITARNRYENLPLKLLGAFQRDNLALAVAVAEAYDRNLHEPDVRRAAIEVEIPGRLEKVGSNPITLIDGAHNPAAMQALCGSLEEIIGGKRLIAVLSILDDKDVPAMLGELLPRCRSVVCTKSSHERSVPASSIQELCLKRGFEDAYCVEDPRDAVVCARKLADGDGAVLICGSIYLLADLEEGFAGQSGELKTAA